MHYLCEPYPRPTEHSPRLQILHQRAFRRSCRLPTVRRGALITLAVCPRPLAGPTMRRVGAADSLLLPRRSPLLATRARSSACGGGFCGLRYAWQSSRAALPLSRRDGRRRDRAPVHLLARYALARVRRRDPPPQQPQPQRRTLLVACRRAPRTWWHTCGHRRI